MSDRLDDIVRRDAHMQNDRGTHETVAESLEKVAEAVAKAAHAQPKPRWQLPSRQDGVAVGKIVVIALLGAVAVLLVVLSLLR